jgi:hypothetical protein
VSGGLVEPTRRRPARLTPDRSATHRRSRPDHLLRLLAARGTHVVSGIGRIGGLTGAWAGRALRRTRLASSAGGSAGALAAGGTAGAVGTGGTAGALAAGGTAGALAAGGTAGGTPAAVSAGPCHHR